MAKRNHAKESPSLLMNSLLLHRDELKQAGSTLRGAQHDALATILIADDAFKQSRQLFEEFIKHPFWKGSKKPPSKQHRTEALPHLVRFILQASGNTQRKRVEKWVRAARNVEVEECDRDELLFQIKKAGGIEKLSRKKKGATTETVEKADTLDSASASSRYDDDADEEPHDDSERSSSVAKRSVSLSYEKQSEKAIALRLKLSKAIREKILKFKDGAEFRARGAILRQGDSLYLEVESIRRQKKPSQARRGSTSSKDW